jgi:DNA-binding transcriptional MerR regulator
MSRPAVAIPEKLFFKIGEVCELAGVQAHVLRYWESEFPMLAPQKNRAGQRVYRKRDVEMALRIKELLYEDQYTIAGAKKRLTNELRGGPKLKVNGDEESPGAVTERFAPNVTRSTAEERQGLKQLAAELRELLSLLEQETKERSK